MHLSIIESGHHYRRAFQCPASAKNHYLKILIVDIHEVNIQSPIYVQGLTPNIVIVRLQYDIVAILA